MSSSSSSPPSSPLHRTQPQSQSQSQSNTHHPFDAIFYAFNAHSDSSESGSDNDTDTDTDTDASDSGSGSGSGSDSGSDSDSDDIDVDPPAQQYHHQYPLHQYPGMASSPLNLNMPSFKFGPLLKQTSFRDLSHLARKQESCFNSAAYLRTRACLRPQDHADSPHHNQPGLDSLIAHRLPETLCETVLPVPAGFDKVFASQWIDDHHILIGTKCNRLLLLSTLTPRIVEIPYLSVTTGATASAHTHSPSSSISTRSPLYRGDAHARAPHLARQDSGIGGMPSGAASGAPARPARPSARTPDSPLACVGIHSIAVNPSRTRMAVGSGKPYEVVVYSLPEMVPVCLMTGHSDLVFSLTFVSDDVLVTASRDTTVGIFSLRSDPAEHLATECGVLPVIRPMGMRQEHTSKVRDIKYNATTRQLTTLGLDSTVRLWDVNRMNVTSKTNLHFPQETVCLGLDTDRSLISIGSQAHVSLLDTRTLGNRNERIPASARILHSFKSPDEGWGVRSLAHNQHLVTCGGGMGRIGFYDLRALHFLPVGDAKVGYLEARMYDGAGAGSGYGEGMTGRARTAGAAVRSAIYTLAYSEDKTRLFAGGGPLQLGMRGTYCAVW